MTTAERADRRRLEALIEAHAIELQAARPSAALPRARRRGVREQQTPIAYLAALLEAEIAERAERRETPPTDRRPLPADQAPGGLPLRRQPQGPAGHDRRARRGLLDR